MNTLSFLFALLLFNTIFFADADHIIQVKTRKGLIKGKQLRSYGGQEGYGFMGIPMAKPPVGNLRFRAPVEADSWLKVLDTTKYKDACIATPKYTYKDSDGPISEDCLYINVFASEKCLKKGNCSVMAVVHGGAFNFESPVVFDPEVIVNNFANNERNVIVVGIPYRVGTLGWFNPLPGKKISADTNVGLRDVIFGLEWIQKEIANFGGNKNRVSLFGHSAGGFLVQLITISPYGQGLFSQLISMSPGMFQLYNSTNSAYSKKFPQFFKCQQRDEIVDSEARMEEILACLRKYPASDILTVQQHFETRVEDTYGPWIDYDVLPGNYEELLKKVKPFNALIGTVKSEMETSRSIADDNGNLLTDRLAELCTHIAFELGYDYPYSFLPQCINYYKQETTYYDMVDDLSFYMPLSHYADVLTSNGGKAFMYSFDYATGEAFAKYSPNSPSPSHSEDYIYIFGLHRAKFSYKDYLIEKIYSGMVADFSNKGDPTPSSMKWPTWNAKTRNFFTIDFNEALQMPGSSVGYHSSASTFWNSVAYIYGGTTKLIYEFPPLLDCYGVMSSADAVVTSWLDTSLFRNKPLKVALQIYDLWTIRLKHLMDIGLSKGKVQLHDFPVNNTDNDQMDFVAPSYNVENVNSTSTSTYLLMGILTCVVLVLFFIVVKLCLYWKKQRQYESI